MNERAVPVVAEKQNAATEHRWWMRRRSEGYLYWHSYKTDEARQKWARIYYGRDDSIWMHPDGSDSRLFVLDDREQWHP